jgi:hypothetical protein
MNKPFKEVMSDLLGEPNTGKMAYLLLELDMLQEPVRRSLTPQPKERERKMIETEDVCAPESIFLDNPGYRSEPSVMKSSPAEQRAYD